MSLTCVVLPPAFGAISDKTGLKKDFTIETSGYDFKVDSVANFEINDVKFTRDDKKLAFDITSSLENNFAEIQIPINLIDGDLTVFVNGEEIFPQIRKNEQISFIVVEFNGTGHNSMEIIGTTYLPEFSSLTLLVTVIAFCAVIMFIKLKSSNHLQNLPTG
ncbi:MAG TPA: hypothetical protein VLD38_05410 [Nitrosopumilaceae archaeon]|nr:hypothetical protein [Nitrosopumilaceae archaeon]